MTIDEMKEILEPEVDISDLRTSIPFEEFDEAMLKDIKKIILTLRQKKKEENQ